MATLCCVGCARQNLHSERVARWMAQGRFTSADSLLVASREGASSPQRRQIDSLREVMRRWRIEFPYNQQQIRDQVSQRLGSSVSDSQLRQWETRQQLEMRWIDGERRYFQRAASNLMRLDTTLFPRPVRSYYSDALEHHLRQVIDVTRRMGDCSLPLRMTLHYTLTVQPNAAPAGDTVRCWLPYPQEGLERQQQVELLTTSPAAYWVAPIGTPQRSIYLQQVALRDSAMRFEVVFRVTTRAQYFAPDSLEGRVRPYNTSSALYRTFTAARPPHILLDRQVAAKARAVVGAERNPVRMTRRIYDWIDDHFPWAGAIEYGVIASIPDYVLRAGHGDCGQVSLLLISMLRSVGIPARWESGWWLMPGDVGLHDWASVYYEGVGWVPIDMSFGKQPSRDPAVRIFYRSGIDRYRLIVNSDYGLPLVPAKRWMRSEPVDFQRGEVECSAGNLYFDQWDYSMEVTYDE